MYGNNESSEKKGILKSPAKAAGPMVAYVGNKRQDVIAVMDEGEEWERDEGDYWEEEEEEQYEVMAPVMEGRQQATPDRRNWNGPGGTEKRNWNSPGADRQKKLE